jgi:hypothetical protein
MGLTCMACKRSGVRIPLAPRCDLSRDPGQAEPSPGIGLFVCAGWAPGFAGGLVVPGWVEGEFAEQFAGGGVDDADAQVLGEHDDGGSGVGAADADVVEAAVVAEGDFAVGVDAVGADAVVGVGAAVAGGGFWAGRGRRWRGSPAAAGTGVGGDGCSSW